MRRLIVILVIVMTVFVTSAMATSFVSERAVLASASGAVGPCAETLDLAWTIGDYEESVDDWPFDNVEVSAGVSCASRSLTLQLLDSDGHPLGRQAHRTLGSSGSARFDAADLDVGYAGSISSVAALISD